MNTSPARIGYARISTADQNLDAQIAALKKAGCSMIRTETGDGATLAGRPELRTILDFIHPGETLVVTRIDRLARSMRDLQVIVATLKDKGAHLAATEQPVDTSTAAGKAFFDMLGVFAEFETNLRRERQAEGIAAAKQRGAYRGRPPRIDMAAIQQRLATGLSPTQIARELGVSRGTVYKAKADMRHSAWRAWRSSVSRHARSSSTSRCATERERRTGLQDVHLCTFGPLGPSTRAAGELRRAPGARRTGGGSGPRAREPSPEPPPA